MRASARVEMGKGECKGGKERTLGIGRDLRRIASLRGLWSRRKSILGETRMRVA